MDKFNKRLNGMTQTREPPIFDTSLQVLRPIKNLIQKCGDQKPQKNGEYSEKL